MTTATVVVGSYRSQRLALSLGERTWTVLGKDHRMVEPAEEYLEYLRAQQASPNTVKSYARALALWWQYLDAFGLRWEAVTLADFGAFLTWLRTGDGPGVVSIERRAARFAESTIAARLRAVISCYDYHVLNGLDVGRDLHRITHRGGGRYKPLLEHISRRKGRRQAVIGVRHCRQVAPPILTPQQIERIYEACASWDNETREWRGSVRNRLLWMLLAETGLRLGEALGVAHRDWHTGRGDTPFIEVVARDHPHAVRAKSGYRRLYISDELDRLYGEYVWQLCDAGADLVTDDFDATCVFVNLDREPRFAPWRPESVYDLVDRLRRQLSGQVPQTWTPHWMRHSHATALLLSLFRYRNKDNNCAERAVRPVKVQQRTSGGCWRTLQGLIDFALVHSYLDTATKWGIDKLHALQQLFTTGPWLPPALTPLNSYHRASHAVDGAEVGEFFRGVLAAAVAVEDDAVGGFAGE